VVRAADAGYVANRYCLRFDRGVVRVADAGYVANRYCFRFDRGVVRAADAGYVANLTVGNIASISSTNNSSVKPQAITVGNIASISSEEWFVLLMLAMLPTVIG
jgi:hypothetical protein